MSDIVKTIFYNEEVFMRKDGNAYQLLGPEGSNIVSYNEMLKRVGLRGFNVVKITPIHVAYKHAEEAYQNALNNIE
ncbi:MAG: hypothetical protein J7K26_03720 [Candidatus Aenigmarchaeota archaeon]|nr:hypothetical protein [Candidatus Aenigmarchaeota archaeon]